MSTLQAALLHSIGGIVAVAAAVVLALTGHIDGTVALAIVVSGTGISGTGVAGTVAASSAARAQPPAAPASSATRTPPSTT